ncbi:MAG: hypothetical protein RL616_2406 [Verrucomicrobiota bacterium]
MLKTLQNHNTFSEIQNRKLVKTTSDKTLIASNQ